MIKETELINFIKFIIEVHTDEYGHLQLCEKGDELEPTYENVVREYLSVNEKFTQEEFDVIERDVNHILNTVSLNDKQIQLRMKILNKLKLL